MKRFFVVPVVLATILSTHVNLALANVTALPTLSKVPNVIETIAKGPSDEDATWPITRIETREYKDPSTGEAVVQQLIIREASPELRPAPKDLNCTPTDEASTESPPSAIESFKGIRFMFDETIYSADKSRNIIWACVLAMLIAACQAQPNAGDSPPTPTTTPPVEVVTEVLPPPNPTATSACTPLSVDMTLSVTPLSPSSAEIEITGLQAGEKPILIYYAEIPGQAGSRVEDRPIQTADTEGRYTYTAQGLQPIAGGASNQWQIQVVHQKGVACTEVTLPAS